MIAAIAPYLGLVAVLVVSVRVLVRQFVAARRGEGPFGQMSDSWEPEAGRLVDPNDSALLRRRRRGAR
jgi:hypothetical protein